MPRSNISLDKAVFDKFSSRASQEGKTLYAFTNEWLDAASNISAEGGSAAEVARLWRSSTVIGQLDTLMLPSDFVDHMVQELYANDKAKLLKSFSDLGADLVGVLKMATDDVRGLADLVKTFGLLTPIKKFEFKDIDRNTVETRIVGVGKSIEATECCFAFLKAVLNGYGYEILSDELHAGTITATAAKRRII
jgi:hypothetical protein